MLMPATPLNDCRYYKPTDYPDEISPAAIFWIAEKKRAAAAVVATKAAQRADSPLFYQHHDHEGRAVHGPPLPRDGHWSEGYKKFLSKDEFASGLAQVERGEGGGRTLNQSYLSTTMLNASRSPAPQPRTKETKMTPPDPDRVMSRKEAASYLRRRYTVGSVSLLAHMSMTNSGPKLARLGRRCIYRAQDLDEWARAQIASGEGRAHAPQT
jgi:hypothetical protein